MDRTQRWLAWGLGIQIVLLAILHPPLARRTASASEPLLPALASLAPRMLEIAAADGGSVTLVRGSGGWSLGKPPGYPVLGDKVDQLLRTLRGLTAGRPGAGRRRSPAPPKGGRGPGEPPGLPGARRQGGSPPPAARGSPRGPPRREQPPLARRAQGRGRRVRAPPPRLGGPRAGSARRALRGQLAESLRDARARGGERPRLRGERPRCLRPPGGRRLLGGTPAGGAALGGRGRPADHEPAGELRARAARRGVAGAVARGSREIRARPGQGERSRGKPLRAHARSTRRAGGPGEPGLRGARGDRDARACGEPGRQRRVPRARG